MSLQEYNVVIIGGSLVGRYAALRATQLKAKVALVEPPYQAITAPNQKPLQVSPWLDFLTPHALSYIGQLTQQLNNVSQFGIDLANTDAAQTSKISLQSTEVLRWVEGVGLNLEDQNSLNVLSALGVDVIIGSGKFEQRRRAAAKRKTSLFAFTVSDRQLLAQTYLIATGSRPAVPEIEGLQATGYVTPTDIWQPLTSENPPARWAIIGGDPTAIVLAQTLTRLGLNVTLIIKRSHILAKEDPEIAQLLQANLEAEGVRVLTNTSIIHVKRIEEKKWIQAGDKAIEVDEILLGAGCQPNIEALNLEAVGVKWYRHRLLLNQKLQTTNPRIYACGDVVGGYQFANIANYEAKIALKNALFFPIFKVDYSSIPWTIFSDPPIARVGLNEVQARQQYKHDVVVLRQYFKSITAAQLQDKTTGICKLVMLRNGKILGAAIVGSQSGELITLFALAITQKLKIDAITLLAPVYPSFAEILDHITIAWTQQRLTNNTALQNFLENFFNCRRSWRL